MQSSKKIRLFSILSLALTAYAHADLQRFIRVSSGIYRGDQPDTLEDYKTLKKYGIKTIVNLRNEPELVAQEAKVAKSMSMKFYSFPMDSFEYPAEETVNGALEAITHPSLQPVYVHCRQGKDRTGLIIGLYRVFYEDWSADDAYREMKENGFSFFVFDLKRYFKDHTRGM